MCVYIGYNSCDPSLTSTKGRLRNVTDCKTQPLIIHVYQAGMRIYSSLPLCPHIPLIRIYASPALQRGTRPGCSATNSREVA